MRRERAAAAPDAGGANGVEFAQRVMRWQRAHGRHDLPWQGTRDPYRIWLSEVMLQQTQVATVREYFVRFLQRFPDLATLARASLDDVLAAWSGLGYYSRARNLHRCAQQVMTAHGGAWPQHSAGLAQLPGIGRSTAAAIAAFCFGERAAILDGNVKRVLARVLGFDADLAMAANERRLWQAAEALLPARGIETYTQGLMDLGATVCLRSQPRCAQCPLGPVCDARRTGRQSSLPVRRRRQARGRRDSALLWLRQGHRLWLQQRPATGVWAGLWSLPERDTVDDWRRVAAQWPGNGRTLAPIEHALTHFDWRLQPLCWTLPARLPAAQRMAIEAAAGGGRWFTPTQALALGLPAPVRRLIEAGAN